MMKLYAFYPDGHGPFSFFVMAETEEEAIAAIEEERKKHDDYNSSGFGSINTSDPYYIKKVVGKNVVMWNSND